MNLRVQNYNKRNKGAIPELWKLLPLAKFFSKSLVDSKINCNFATYNYKQ